MDLGWLYQRMQTAAQRPAIISDDQGTSYAALLERTAEWRRRLVGDGVRAGDVVAARGSYSPDTVSLLLALMEADCVAVPLSPAHAPLHPEFLETAQVGWLLDFTGGDAAVKPLSPRVDNPLLLELRRCAEPGLIVFTSGSTGKNKAALHSCRQLLEKFKLPRHRYTSLAFLMFDHLGGFNTVMYVLSNGGTVVTLREHTPETVCRAIERHRVELLPTSPTFLNLLLMSEAHRRHDLSSLKLVTYGTEMMPASTLARVRQALPRVSLQQTYGLSELGVLRTKSRDDGSLWVKVGGEGFETRVRDGILWIRARSAMLGYLNAPSPFDAEGWFNTGDEVEVDGEYLRFKGRRSEIINVGGEKVFPAEVESVLLECPNVKDAVVYGERNPITGASVAARLNLQQPEEVSELRRRLRAFCRARLAAFKVPARIEVVAEPLYNERIKRTRPLDDPEAALQGAPK